MRLVAHLAALTLIVAQVTSVARDGPMTASAAAREIGKDGGKAFIQKHFDREPWSQLIHGIETADPAWLAVGESLRRHSDAASSEELGLAFYAALAVDPLRVIPVLQRIYGFGPEGLCNQTFEAELPKQGVQMYVAAIERGLSRARTAAERKLADSCRAGLESTRRYAREHGLK